MLTPHNILMLAFPNGQLLDIAGPLQMFAGANDELSRQGYRIEIGAPQAGPFTTSSGVRLVADVAFAQITNKRLARIHTVIAVGGEPGMRHHATPRTVCQKTSDRLSRYFEGTIASAEAFLYAASVMLLTRRLARSA